MKQWTIVACAALMLVGFSGCSSSGPDALVQDQIKVMNDLCDALEAKTVDPEKIKQLKARGEEIEKKFKELKLSEADEKALKEKHKAAMEKAGMRMLGAMMKAATTNPEIGKLLDK